MSHLKFEMRGRVTSGGNVEPRGGIAGHGGVGNVLGVLVSDQRVLPNQVKFRLDFFFHQANEISENKITT